MSHIDTVATISDDGKTAIFISRDVDFIARIEDARYFENAVCLGHIDQFALYSHPTSGYDFGSLVFGISADFDVAPLSLESVTPYEDIPPHTDADVPYSAAEIEERFWELLVLP